MTEDYEKKIAGYDRRLDYLEAELKVTNELLRKAITAVSRVAHPRNGVLRRNIHNLELCAWRMPQ